MREKPARRKQVKPNRGKARSSREKVRAFRARRRAKGMRAITIWVPDTRAPKFAAEARRQCLAVNASRRAAEDQRWVEAMQGLND
jgi:hypothetical protein